MEPGVGDSGYDSQRRVLMLGGEGGSGGSGLGHGDATMEGAGGTAGAPARPAAALHSARPPGPPRQARGGRHLRREVEMANGKCQDSRPGVTSGKSATAFGTASPQGTRLLKDCFGIETAASQETSCTSASNSPWEGGGSGGPAWGTEEEMGRGEVPWQGVSRQKLASPTEISFLEGWQLLVA